MPTRNHRKRAVLFVAAVLLPSAVLVGTTVRLIRQQRELAVRRIQEEQSLLALRVGQELTEALGRLEDRIGPPDPSFPNVGDLPNAEPGLLTLAAVNGSRLVYPWEMDPDPFGGLGAEGRARYTRLLERGEEAEYRAGNLLEAADLYGQAVRVAEVFLEAEGGGDESEGERPGQATAVHLLLAEARIHQARALLRAERMEEACIVFRLLAECPPALFDREGIPFVIYGLEGLHRCGMPSQDLLSLLETTFPQASVFSLPALLAWKDVALEIAPGAEGGAGPELRQAVEEAFGERLSTLETLEELDRDFPGLLTMARGGRGERGELSGSDWIPYGREPWLVGIFAPEGEAARVAVVQPAVLLDALWERKREDSESGEGGDSRAELSGAMEKAELLPAGDPDGESLGPNLNGLRASFPPGFPPPSDAGGVEGWFFRLLLPLILVLTGFTAYLAWRDVRREEEAIQLRSRFVSSVTHELKTPLTSIRMFVETIRLGRHSSPEVQQEYLDTVVHETERLSRLINNVLDFARIERGEKTYRLALADVGIAAQEAARAVAYPLAQGEYELVADIAPDLPRVEVDADALTQALLNLLSNAIKFSPERSRIDLRVFQEGTDILLQVEDRGRGIAPRDQETIFQDFVRTDEAEREGIPGTGLGLPLVAHVAEAHGGRVEVESEVGQGSTFTLRIPVRGLAPEEDMAS